MFLPGRVLAGYRVESTLGSGGAATVYLVQDEDGVERALKVVAAPSESQRQRLLQEGEIQRRLRHPNLVAVLGVVEVDGAPGLVLEYVRGPSLTGWIARGPPLADRLSVFRGILAAVAHAHANGIVHRDLKPANVLLDESTVPPTPRVTDFGIAKVTSAEGDLTRTGAMLGTARYMAPEQIRDARAADERTDVYALGCILYELCCGRPPFEGNDVVAIHAASTAGRWTEPRALGAQVPDGVAVAIRGALAPDPADRIPDCATLGRVIDGAPFDAPVPQGDTGSDPTWQASEVPPRSFRTVTAVEEPPPSRRRAAIAAGAALLATGAAIAWWTAPRPDRPPPEYDLSQLTSTLERDVEPGVDGRGAIWFARQVRQTNQHDLFRLEPDGRTTRITRTDERSEARPDPHPDGTRVVVARDDGTLVLDEHGAVVGEVTACRGRPARWQADGRALWCLAGGQVLRVPWPAGEPEVVRAWDLPGPDYDARVEADGRGRLLVLWFEELWLVDGEPLRLSDHATDARFAGDGRLVWLESVRPQGVFFELGERGRRRLATVSRAREFDLAPDGSIVTATHEVDQQVFVDRGSGPETLVNLSPVACYDVTPDLGRVATTSWATTDQVVLHDLSAGTSATVARDGCPSLSPDGAWLALTPDGETGPVRVVRRADGWQRDLDLRATAPGAWSPGAVLAVPTREGLYRVDLPDGAPVRLAEGNFGAVSWSSSGDRVAAIRRTVNDQLGVAVWIDPAGGPATTLADVLASARSAPVFADDGLWVVRDADRDPVLQLLHADGTAEAPQPLPIDVDPSFWGVHQVRRAAGGEWTYLRLSYRGDLQRLTPLTR